MTPAYCRPLLPRLPQRSGGHHPHNRGHRINPIRGGRARTHSIRGHDWVGGLPEGLAPVRVTVAPIPVEHTVKIRDFTNWVERKGGSPREMTDRERVRAMLQLAR